MSNHSGSYLLNGVLKLLNEHHVFESLGKDKTLKFMKALAELAHSEDCNSGEILEGIGTELSICYYCWNYGKNLEDGLCEKCRKRYTTHST